MLSGLLLRPEQDGMGPWPLLMMISGHAAMERESEQTEPIDLIKALYIVDLEHVTKFWDDWEGFEALVSNQRLGNGQTRTYINRIHYLIYFERIRAAQKPDSIRLFPPVSPILEKIVKAARELASKREGSGITPTSRDLLFSVCSHDPELKSALEKSGLQIEKLAEAVSGKR